MCAQIVNDNGRDYKCPAKFSSKLFLDEDNLAIEFDKVINIYVCSPSEVRRESKKGYCEKDYVYCKVCETRIGFVCAGLCIIEIFSNFNFPMCLALSRFEDKFHVLTRPPRERREEINRWTASTFTTLERREELHVRLVFAKRRSAAEASANFYSAFFAGLKKSGRRRASDYNLVTFISFIVMYQNNQYCFFSF